MSLNKVWAMLKQGKNTWNYNVIEEVKHFTMILWTNRMCSTISYVPGKQMYFFLLNFGKFSLLKISKLIATQKIYDVKIMHNL